MIGRSTGHPLTPQNTCKPGRLNYLPFPHAAIPSFEAGWLEFLLTCVICGYVYIQLLILNIPMLD